MLTVPNTQTANPALDDFYATVQRGSVFRAKCPAGASPLKIQAVFDYTAAADRHDLAAVRRHDTSRALAGPNS